MNKLLKIFLPLSGLAAVLVLTGCLTGEPSLYRPSSVIAVLSLAIGLGTVASLKGYRYTAWIIAAVVIGMMYPEAFTKWGSVNLRDKTLMLVVIQLVMFGTGTQMSLKEFNGIATTGKGVLVGMLCQFTIMPFTGFFLTKIFHFEPEIAAGVILIGCCSSGLASNVMVYLSRANLVLSVLVTAMATLAAPLLTPLMMKLLAGTLVEVNFLNMMMDIVKMVIVPIGAALLHDYLKTASRQSKRWVYLAGLLSIVWIVILISLSKESRGVAGLSQTMVLSGFMAGAILAAILYHFLYTQFRSINQWMPLISMAGIIYFTVVTTAAGRDSLLKVGFLLFLAAFLHNTMGYFLGYWFSRLLKLDIPSARTIAFEVGLQNGGMASGIAGSMGKLGTVGLAAAVFSPWMNISGSILANYWRKKTEKMESEIASTNNQTI
jgi:BASS family bile acid:Na+ symporter